jgi:Mg2+ and Co2+ transporter CorA
MNDKMFIALMKRYEAEIEDAIYRIDAINEHNLIIPEHTDILGEVDKMLQKISNAEDRLAALRRHYGQKNVFLSFWSRSVDFIDFRVDKLGDKSCLGRQIILSLYRKAFRETFCFCLTNLKLSRSLI